MFATKPICSSPNCLEAIIFAAAFATLAISFWPYIVPFSITIDQAAAPRSSLGLMFWAQRVFVFPLMLAYATICYRVFRGKVKSSVGQYRMTGGAEGYAEGESTVMDTGALGTRGDIASMGGVEPHITGNIVVLTTLVPLLLLQLLLLVGFLGSGVSAGRRRPRSIRPAGL
jgi:Cytochrome bd terminal oxidase subunit II